MRLAIISDIHANRHALLEALKTIRDRGADAIVCCGDVVGYGGDPEVCVDVVRRACIHTVLGNHDLAVATGEGISMLPSDGQDAAMLHRDVLTDDQLQWLAGLPDTVQLENITLVHATPDVPRRWGRLAGYNDAMAQFDRFEGDICFMGHTHRPSIMANKIGVFSIRAGVRYLVNVGSTGQPRDGDPRAAVAFFETDTLGYELARIPYDAHAAARRIEERHLPRSLADRLRYGR